MLRTLIKTNDLPEYILVEKKGMESPILFMYHRDLDMETFLAGVNDITIRQKTEEEQ
ncbi:hypothetical protein [Xenorhabdus khoisanae]|uniref:hypothetical protein n=1 Tax=Xenorhabdus khoisanae TaxID=880157 RepID=UPI0013792BCF|nr:hypothetical protein [Xenorhabdus khoisanae]